MIAPPAPRDRATRGALPAVAAAVAVAAALAVVAAAAVIGGARGREGGRAPLATVESGDPAGLLAARRWLEATGRDPRVLREAADAPAAGEVLLLVAPAERLADAEAGALLAHAERGGTVVWAMGGVSQPALERRLGVSRAAPPNAEGRGAVALAPHPLFEGILLRGDGATLRIEPGAALPAAGGPEGAAAASVALGSGEAVVLADAGALGNLRLGEAENLALLARLSALGRVAFDERWLRTTPGRASPPWRGWVLAQAIAAAALFVLALGRRLGAVRAPAEAGSRPTSRGYLEALGALYRRAGGEAELREEAWRSLRRRLERAAGVPSLATDEEAARRLAARSPDAARAFARARAARARGGAAGLVALVQSASATEVALRRRRAR